MSINRMTAVGVSGFQTMDVKLVSFVSTQTACTLGPYMTVIWYVWPKYGVTNNIHSAIISVMCGIHAVECDHTWVMFC